MGTHSRDGHPMQSRLLDQYATGWLGPWLDPLYLLVCCTYSTVVLCAGLQACISCSRCCALGFVGTPPCVVALFHTGLTFTGVPQGAAVAKPAVPRSWHCGVRPS